MGACMCARMLCCVRGRSCVHGCKRTRVCVCVCTLVCMLYRSDTRVLAFLRTCVRGVAWRGVAQCGVVWALVCALLHACVRARARARACVRAFAHMHACYIEATMTPTTPDGQSFLTRTANALSMCSQCVCGPTRWIGPSGQPSSAEYLDRNESGPRPTGWHACTRARGQAGADAGRRAQVGRRARARARRHADGELQDTADHARHGISQRWEELEEASHHRAALSIPRAHTHARMHARACTHARMHAHARAHIPEHAPSSCQPMLAGPFLGRCK